MLPPLFHLHIIYVWIRSVTSCITTSHCRIQLLVPLGTNHVIISYQYKFTQCCRDKRTPFGTLTLTYIVKKWCARKLRRHIFKWHQCIGRYSYGMVSSWHIMYALVMHRWCHKYMWWWYSCHLIASSLINDVDDIDVWSRRVLECLAFVCGISREIASTCTCRWHVTSFPRFKSNTMQFPNQLVCVVGHCYWKTDIICKGLCHIENSYGV